MTEASDIRTIELSDLDLRMIIASLEGTLQDAAVAFMSGDTEAFSFLFPLANLVTSLKAVRDAD
jgi:hypothetical protein